MKFRVFRIRRTINDVYLSGTINKVYVIFQLNLQLLYPSAKLMQKKFSFVDNISTNHTDKKCSLLNLPEIASIGN